MSADLGLRLQRAGLITREQLAETLAVMPLHGSALVRALVRRGTSEDALVGFFVAEGFGPLMTPRDLEGADTTLAARLPPTMLAEFALLPIRAVDGRWVVAMVAPSERHVVSEIERIASVRVIPAVARWSELRPALARLGALEGERDTVTDVRAPSEPPVIELVRRRPSHAPPGEAMASGGAERAADSGYRARSDADATMDAKLALSAEDAVPLVRHKPISRPSSSPPEEKIVARSFAPPREPSAPARAGLWARGRSATAPLDTEGGPAEKTVVLRPRPAKDTIVEPRPLGARPEETATLPTSAPAAAEEPYGRKKVTVPPPASSPRSVAPAPRTQTLAPPAMRAEADERERARARATADLDARARADAKAKEEAQVAAKAEADARADAEAARERAEAEAKVEAEARAEAEAAEARERAEAEAAEARERADADAKAAAEQEEARARTEEAVAAGDAARELERAADAAAEAEARAALGSGAGPAAEESWAVPPAVRAAASGAARASASNKLSPRAVQELAPAKQPLGDVRGVLVSIRQARDRDEVVGLALDGALSVSRSAVFFALRKGLLKGWDGIGSGVTQDSARNLWIPTSTASLFQRVVESGVGYFGPYGSAIADGLFRAAVGSRGGDLALLPIKVSGKVVGLLAADDVRGGPLGQQRLELIVTAVDEAFARIIVQQKHG